MYLYFKIFTHVAFGYFRNIFEITRIETEWLNCYLKKWFEIITVSAVALPTRFDVKAMFVDREWRNSWNVKVRILCTCQMQNVSIVIDVNANKWVARMHTRQKLEENALTARLKRAFELNKVFFRYKTSQCHWIMRFRTWPRNEKRDWEKWFYPGARN